MFFRMAQRSDGCSGETLVGPCAKRKRLQRKLTKDYYLPFINRMRGPYREIISPRF